MLTAGQSELAFRGSDCVYQLPDCGSAEWRGPLYFADGGTGQVAKRFLALGERKSDSLHITDSYVTSNWAVARVHHNYTRDPLTCRDVLDGIVRSFGCYLRLYNPDAPTSADEWKIHSRHSLTPRLAGTLDTDAVGEEPVITACECYDGAQANVGNEKIEKGDVAASNKVFNVSGLFLTPNWARVLTERIYREYPRQSSTYTNGRRVFSLDARAFDTTEIPLGYRNLFERVTVSVFSDITNVTCLLLGVGFDRATFRYAATLIEWSNTGVDWASNEVTPSLSLYACPAEDVAAQLSTFTATRSIVGCEFHPHVELTPAENPKDGPCAFFWKFRTPHRATRLIGYLYGMTRDGIVGAIGSGPMQADGNMFFAVWTDSQNEPNTRLDASMAYAAATTPGVPSMDGIPEGANLQLLNGPTELTSMDLEPDKEYWAYCSMDRDDDATSGDVSCPVVAPPVESWHGSRAGQYVARRLSFADVTGNPDNNAWLDSTDYDAAKAAWPTTADVELPAVYVVLEEV